MIVSDVLAVADRDMVTREVYLHQFVDELRRSNADGRKHAISLEGQPKGSWSAVVAATVECICAESHEPPPAWTSVVSETPVYIPAVAIDSKAAQVLRRITPGVFRKHNVFVSPKFLSRC
jgi:hypothetical protein